MRLAGFVHRDISPGNCLIYNGQTKISDLEYARRYAAPVNGPAPLTGTPGFMAFNFLHDLESVVWIYLWFLLDTLPKAFTSMQIEQHKTAILRLNHMLFNFRWMSRLSSAYGEVVDALTAVHGVDSKLLKALDSFKTLSSCYRIVESSQPLLVESPQATHWDRKVFLHKFYKAIHFYFMDAHEQMKDKNDRARPLREEKRRAPPTAVLPRGRKRQRTCTDNEARIPPLREEQDEKSDSEAPPEETQLGQNKRNRGVRA
ncbi:hypothetical protein CPB85DRAFT_1361524 [Mucidula mucida]|nr:hypothetical protein CPB85DRAFT_1361524 [Mucidula mucida]